MYFPIVKDFIKQDALDWSLFKGSPSTKYESDGVVFEYFKIANFNKFLMQHKKRICYIEVDRVYYCEMKGKGVLYPHKDHGVTVALNYYIEASLKDMTCFYKVRSDVVKPFVCRGEETANIYHPEDLVRTECFLAQNKSVFLLDVSEIHSVLKESDETRTFISYHWKTASFRDVLQSIKESN